MESLDILVVDDDPSQRLIVEMALVEIAGWQVWHAESGEQALELLETRTPDAILLDMLMPGMDGLQTLQAILERGHREPAVIFMSGASEPDDDPSLLRAGAAGIIAKPFDPIELPGRIEKIVTQVRALPPTPPARPEPEQHAPADDPPRSAHATARQVANVASEFAADPTVLRTILEHIPVMVAIYDPSGRVTYVNRCVEVTMGWSAEEWMTGTPFARSLPDREQRAAVAAFIERSDGAEQTFTALDKWGNTHHTAWTNVRLPEGQTLGIGRDVSDAYRADRSDQRLASLVAQTSDAVIGIDKVGIVQEWNAASERMFGWRARDVVGLHVSKLPPTKEEEARQRELIERVRKGEQIHNVSAVRVHKDGHAVDVALSLAPLYTHDGRFEGVSAIMRDVTEERNRTRELEHLTQVLEATPDFVSYGDEDRGIYYANQSMLSAIGRTKEDDLDFTEVYPPWAWERLEKEGLPTAIKDGMWRGESALLRADGTEIPVDQILISHRGDHGEVTHCSTIMRDMTAAKEYERQLEAAKDAAEEANVAKSEFLANMSHEIRTPMNAVIGMAGLLVEADLPARELERAKTIRNSAEQLLALVNDILDFSKIESNKLDIERIRCDARAVIENVAQSLANDAHGRDVDLIVAIHPDVPSRVVCDPVRLQQVATNLMSNAIKFTRQGHVVVSLHCSRAGGTESLHLTVRDTGTGIAPDRLEAIFESFTQANNAVARDFGGTGLGLTIVRRLMNLMGGSIQVESELGSGSTFTASFPFPRSDNLSAHTPPSLTSGEILVISDNPAVSESLCPWLTAAGMQPRSCSRDDAMRSLEQGSASVVLFDEAPGELVAVDWGRRIATVRPEARLICLCARTDDHAPHGYASAIQKPLRVNALLASLHTATGSAAPPPRWLDDGTTEGRDRKYQVHNVRVLLVDDVPAGQLVGRQLLESLGCRVDVAASGLEAIRMHMQTNYDLIFMDCQMPEMDGYEATRRLREGPEDRAKVPIVALTAGVTEAVREGCAAAGMDSFVTKPVRKGELGAVLKEHLDDRVQELEPASDDAKSLPAKFTAIFVRSSLQHLERLERAIDEGDPVAVRFAAHGLKGACGTLATADILHLASKIEETAESGSLSGVAEAYGRLAAALRAACERALPGKATGS